MKDYLFVINPVAGKGEGKNLIPIIHEQFRNYVYKIIISTAPNVITDKVKEELSIDDYDTIVSVGGDGTLREIIDGIEDINIKIGVIPVGSGNDFAKTLDIKKEIDTCIERIKKKEFIEVYVGRANDKRFINVFGAGIDSEILRLRENSEKSSNTAGYLSSTLKALLYFDPIKFKIIIDGEEINTESYLIAVGNGKYFGDGMKITPCADIFSKEFEICIVPKMPRWKMLFAFPTIYGGKHGKIKGVRFLKGKKVEIFYNKNIPVNLDGDLYWEKDVVLEKEERTIKIIK